MKTYRGLYGLRASVSGTDYEIPPKNDEYLEDLQSLLVLPDNEDVSLVVWVQTLATIAYLRSPHRFGNYEPWSLLRVKEKTKNTIAVPLTVVSEAVYHLRGTSIFYDREDKP